MSNKMVTSIVTTSIVATTFGLTASTGASAFASMSQRTAVSQVAARNVIQRGATNRFGGAGNASDPFIRESGPSWVNSPKNFNFQNGAAVQHRSDAGAPSVHAAFAATAARSA